MADLKHDLPLEKVTSSDTTFSTSPSPAVLLSTPNTTNTTPHLESGDIEKASASEVAEANGVVVRREGETDEVFRQREEREGRYLSGLKLILVFSAMLMSVLLIALDQTIVATALPVIASDFNALNKVTWIVSAYFLTQAPLILVYGQVLRFFATKWVFIVAVALFELGSLVCGVANSANVLIFGRAFAGVGAAGIFVSVLSIIAEIVPLQKRPAMFGGFGAVFAVSSVIGPLLGGVFTQHSTWRWCFYLNLPVGGITLVAIVFFVTASAPQGLAELEAEEQAAGLAPKTPLRRFLSLDWIGAILILGVTTCLILALQEGGITKPWNAPSVIAELVVFGVVLVLFVGWEWHVSKKDAALLPMNLFTDRTAVGASISAFFLMLVMLSGIYYLPIFYQAVKAHTPTQSGVDILAFMLAIVLSSMIAGVATSSTGHYYTFLIAGPLLLSPIGAGLLYTVTQDTSSAFLIGAQILVGAGIGMAFQTNIVAVQAAFHNRPKLIPQATALVTFAQLVGGVVGISIAGTLFNNEIKSQLAQRGVSSEVTAAVLISVNNIAALTGDLRRTVLDGYVKALDVVFIIACPAAIIAAIAGAFVKPINVKKVGGMDALMAAA